MFVNNLINKLEENKVNCLCFADDIVLTATRDLNLIKGITVLQKWADSNHLKINYQKSGIIFMKASASNDTKGTIPTRVCQIPVVESYSWLGITLDKSLHGTANSARLTEVSSSFLATLKSSKGVKILSSSRYHLWQTLILSKHSYGAFLMAKYSNRAHDEVKKVMGYLLLALFNIRYRGISYDKLTEAATGIQTLSELIMLRANIDDQLACRNNSDFNQVQTQKWKEELAKANLQTKTIIKHEAESVVKYKSGAWAQCYVRQG